MALARAKILILLKISDSYDKYFLSFTEFQKILILDIYVIVALYVTVHISRTMRLTNFLTPESIHLVDLHKKTSTIALTVYKYNHPPHAPREVCRAR